MKIKQINDIQLKQLAEFCSNLSLVFLASIIAPFFGKIEELNIINSATGFLFAGTSLFISLLILRNIKK